MKTAKIDLHVHLDGSMSVKWMYDKSKEQKVIDENENFVHYYKRFNPDSYEDYEHVFDKFDMPIAIMQDKERLFECAYNFVAMMHEEEILYCEIRFAPQLHTQKGLSQKEATETVVSGLRAAMKDYPDVIAGLLLCCMHKGENAMCNHEANMETVEVAKTLRDDVVLGLDLAGYENNCDFDDYADLFEKANAYSIPYTIHAGEMGNVENIAKALKMKPQRIGHGIDAVKDETILKELVRLQIPLEVCLTSNCDFELNYANHPIYRLIEAGVKITINSDDIAFGDSTLSNEHNVLYRMGISKEQLIEFSENAIDAAFCDNQTKALLHQRYKQTIK